MAEPMRWREFGEDDPRPRVMVVSHERSGTHFLMNTLAECFGYSASPWLNLDTGSVPVNFHSPRGVERFMKGLASQRLATVLKSHHPWPFFAEIGNSLFADFKILYIYRHPLDTLRSYWWLVERATWTEGPRGLSCGEFLQAAPMGYCMRYHMNQMPSMLHRWHAHVEEWLSVAQGNPAILPVRYETLDTRFEETTVTLGKWLGVEPLIIQRPDRYRNVIMPTRDANYAEKCRYDEATLAFVRSVAGPLMVELGYDLPPVRNTA